MAAGLVALGMLTFVNGVLAARGDWFDLALVLAGDAVLRTGAVLVAVAVDSSAALPWAIAAGALAWLPLLAVRPPIRATLGALGSDPVTGLVRRTVTAMGSTVCAALLVAGFPLLLSVLQGARRPDRNARECCWRRWCSSGRRCWWSSTGSGPRSCGPSSTRPAPWVGPSPAGGWCWAGGGLATLLAAAIGPWAVRAVFGDRYSTQAGDLAALTGGSVLIALLVVSGLALIAADRHTASTTGWLASLLARVRCCSRCRRCTRPSWRPCSSRPPRGSSCTPWRCAPLEPWPGPGRPPSRRWPARPEGCCSQLPLTTLIVTLSFRRRPSRRCPDR